MASITKDGVARSSAALGAASAYDTSPTPIPLDNFQSFAFGINYVRGGAGGGPTYKVEFAMDKILTTTSVWYQLGELQAPANASGVTTVDTEQQAEVIYGSTSASAQNFMTPTFAVSGHWVRINFKETGAAGTPGTVYCQCFLTGNN